MYAIYNDGGRPNGIIPNVTEEMAATLPQQYVLFDGDPPEVPAGHRLMVNFEAKEVGTEPIPTPPKTPEQEIEELKNEISVLRTTVNYLLGV
ncbi:hypothetical protein PM3016_1479 [Paenibacillus mucilaginosus 3016]|uniref:Uncharacterized protein n=1 Tax=Paenibacillus mucilaginosus 3016 TaxID=1116391 RepID=H6NGW2_9BACL|nr:hypothetical protein [Paenibacillus mucilaginosus]AFC28404.1 hypothetical protein PM3016_1479 [Paenibacillus mucilaginosus 3016]WFA17203.1 hypothetical protein ERY13_07770 [Paenibacillus mucilaginosus]